MQNTETNILIVDVDTCKMWAEKNPCSQVGFREAYLEASRLIRQGKTVVIKWPKRGKLFVETVSVDAFRRSRRRMA